MPHSFLLELRVEDIPARFLENFESYLKAGTRRILEVQKISCSQPWIALTPRRIAILITGLPDKTQEEKEKVFGPKLASLKNPDGSFPPALLGWSKAKGVQPKDVFLDQSPKGSSLAFWKIKPSRKVSEVLKEEITSLIWSAPFPKTMRWEASGKRFARPIRRLAAFWDKKVIDRKDPNWDHESKKEDLRKNMEDHYRPDQPVSLDFEKLLSEVSWMVEAPEILAGPFKGEYLEIPHKVALAILAKLKVFGLENKQGDLEPRFLCVVERTNSPAARKNIISGYQRVVNAKLMDAKFFWDQDRKKPLIEYREKLKGITWSKELGSLWDKTERVRLFCSKEAQRFGLSAQDQKALDRAVILYKADLATSLVGEYPELAGRAGFYYAQSSNETKETVNILNDTLQPFHIRPPSLLLLLAESLDTLVAQFASGNKPSPKEDPLGLKKVADDVISSCWDQKIGAPLGDLIESCWQGFPQKFSNPASELLGYLRSRLAVWLANSGFAPDRVEAILSAQRFESLPVADIRSCAEAFKDLEKNHHQTLATLALTFKRASNILRQAQGLGASFNGGKVSLDLFESQAEKTLWTEIEVLSRQLSSPEKNLAYPEALAGIAKIAVPLEAFFKEVMVLCENAEVKKNRLMMLDSLKGLVLQIIDPSKLVISNQ